MTKKKSPLIWLTPLTHIAAVTPFVVLVYDYFTNNLTFNPIQAATQRTGKIALYLLVLSLAITPIMSLTKYRVLAPIRRPLGVYAFLYALLHVTIFMGIDFGLNWNLILETMFEKRYTFIGLITFTLMIPLAITSTKGWQKRMGKKWVTLHKLVYIVGPLAILHYSWAVKADLRMPLAIGAIILMLLVLRFPYIKKHFNTKVANLFTHLKKFRLSQSV
jgi:sulfoxide reductase heme-binding subunit YedZ